MDTSEEVLNQNPEPIEIPNFVVIRDDYFVHRESPVFPPTHHEDLPVPPPDESEPSESPSPSPAVSELRSRAVGEGIMRFCEILKAKAISGIFGFGSYAASRCCSVLPATAMAALLVLSLFLLKMPLPWRRRTVSVRGDNEQRLLLLLKHKDEKINQLLLKIAQMNETLSSRGSVPVVRIK